MSWYKAILSYHIPFDVQIFFFLKYISNSFSFKWPQVTDFDYNWTQKWMLQANWNKGRGKGKLFLSNKFISGTKIRKQSFHSNPMRKIALVIFVLNVIIKAQKVYVETESKLMSFRFQMSHDFQHWYLLWLNL